MASVNNMESFCPNCGEQKLINVSAGWHSFVYCSWCAKKFSTDQFITLDMEALKSRPNQSIEYINSILNQK